MAAVPLAVVTSDSSQISELPAEVCWVLDLPVKWQLGVVTSSARSHQAQQSQSFGDLPDGRPVLVTGGNDAKVPSRDPSTGRPPGSPLVVLGPVRSVAVAATFRGLTVAVGGAGVFAAVIPEEHLLPGTDPGVGGG